MIFRRETFSDALMVEILPLLKEHYDELMKHKDIPLSPDIQRYYAFAQAGLLHIVTCRDDEGKMIGYAVCILMKGLHYSTVNFASNDLIFITKKHRNGIAGIRLLRFMEEDLKSLGTIDIIQMHVKREPDFSPILLHDGYEHFETIFQKRIR